MELDCGRVPDGLQKMLEEHGAIKGENNNWRRILLFEQQSQIKISIFTDKVNSFDFCIASYHIHTLNQNVFISYIK